MTDIDAELAEAESWARERMVEIARAQGMSPEDIERVRRGELTFIPVAPCCAVADGRPHASQEILTDD